MKVLLTGAFGNLGTQTLDLLLRRGEHEVRCTDLDTPKNRRKQRKLAGLGAFETHWTDVADAAAVEEAVAGQECVLHFAGVIPPLSEEQPGLTERVNVLGTRNLIVAAEKQPVKPKIVFASSFTVHGIKHACPPPRHVGEEPEPTDNYTHSKVNCEKQLKSSGLPWTILRIGAAVPLDVLEWELSSSMSAMFEIPLDQRIELVHPDDVATAFVNAVTAETAGKTLYVAGGESFQMLFRDYVAAAFDVLGLKSPPEAASRTPKDDSDFYYSDYVDTRNAQNMLAYQNHTFDEYLEETRRKFGWRRPFVKGLSPLVMRFLLRYSPYFGKP